MKNLRNEVFAILEGMNVKVRCVDSVKNGVDKFGISFDIGKEMEPIFYVDDFESSDCNVIASQMLSMLPNINTEITNVNVKDKIADKKYILDNIYIGIEKVNEAQIIKRNTPFNGIQQYMYIVINDEMRTKVTSKFLDVLGIDELDAWFYAKCNTKENAYINTPLPGMVIITNKNGVYGAACALVNKAIREVCGIYNTTRIVLIPSSIHEFICLPFDESTDIENLKEMITSVNDDVVDAVEQLGDEPYIVDIDFGY